MQCSQWAHNPFKLCKTTQNYMVMQNTGFRASGRSGFTITNICYFAINFLYQNFPQHFFWTYPSSTFTFPSSRCLALFHSIMQSTIPCTREIIFSFLTLMHFSLLCSCWWWSISFSPTCFLCNEQKLCKNGSTNQPGAVYVKTTAIWNKSPFPCTLWVLSVHWGKNMSHNLRNSESAANIT